MISFERAKESDAPGLLKAKVRAFEEDLKRYGFGPPGYDSIEDTKRAINKAAYYKILSDGNIIGGFSIYEQGGARFELGSIYIDPDYQNLGVGSKAIGFIENQFPQARKWILDTPYLNFRNHHFYEKAGYVKVGEKLVEDFPGFCLFIYEKNMD